MHESIEKRYSYLNEEGELQYIDSPETSTQLNELSASRKISKLQQYMTSSPNDAVPLLQLNQLKTKQD